MKKLLILIIFAILVLGFMKNTPNSNDGYYYEGRWYGVPDASGVSLCRYEAICDARGCVCNDFGANQNRVDDFFRGFEDFMNVSN